MTALLSRVSSAGAKWSVPACRAMQHEYFVKIQTKVIFQLVKDQGPNTARAKWSVPTSDEQCNMIIKG
jgi:hypothetical protein